MVRYHRSATEFNEAMILKKVGEQTQVVRNQLKQSIVINVAGGNEQKFVGSAPQYE